MTKDRKTIEIYDSTLREGNHREGLSLSIEDKLRIAGQLDRLGIDFIEGGRPGNSKDTEFFSRARKELELHNATLVALGTTRRVNVPVEKDSGLQTLADAETDAVCIVATYWDYHVTQALRTTLDEAEAMVHDSVVFLRARDKQVLVNAEHFFDGYRDNPEFSLRMVRASVAAGTRSVVLCDTNGGTLPHDAGRIVSEVLAAVPDATIGCRFHDDGGCGVANALEAVRAGATHIQGCINGYGERSGNTNLVTLLGNLALKLGAAAVTPEQLQLLTSVAHHVAELVNVAPDPHAPYVGASAFAHKGGLHTSTIASRPDAYEHVAPDAVGNRARFVIGELAGRFPELAGRSAVQRKAAELGVELSDIAIGNVLDDLKRLENEGYHYEVADGSLELLFRRAAGWRPVYFDLESYRVISESGSSKGSSPTDSHRTEATVKVIVGSERIVATGEGNGPVNALDRALRRAIEPKYPTLTKVHLTDYRVRVLDTSKATGAVTRVLIDTSNGDDTWTTIGVSANIIDASWQALAESMTIALLRRPSALLPTVDGPLVAG